MTRSARWSAATRSRSTSRASPCPRQPRSGPPAISISGWPTTRCRRESPPRRTTHPRPGRPSCQTRIPMATEPRTYESAVERLEAIIARLDSNEAGLRETVDLVKEGRELIEYTAGELDAVGKGLEELHLDELIARLEATGPDAVSRN